MNKGSNNLAEPEPIDLKASPIPSPIPPIPAPVEDNAAPVAIACWGRAKALIKKQQ